MKSFKCICQLWSNQFGFTQASLPRLSNFLKIDQFFKIFMLLFFFHLLNQDYSVSLANRCPDLHCVDRRLKVGDSQSRCELSRAFYLYSYCRSNMNVYLAHARNCRGQQVSIAFILFLLILFEPITKRQCQEAKINSTIGSITKDEEYYIRNKSSAS